MVKVPLYLVQEQNLAFHIFDRDVGADVMLDICKPAHAVSTSIFNGLIAYKRIPDKVPSHPLPTRQFLLSTHAL